MMASIVELDVSVAPCPAQQRFESDRSLRKCGSDQGSMRAQGSYCVAPVPKQSDKS